MKLIKELYIKYREIINYLIFGVLTTVVSLGSYYIMTATFLNPENALHLQIANVISWILAVSFAYVTNRKYVFESEDSNKASEAARFFGGRVSTLILDMLCMLIMVSLLHMNDRLAKLIDQVLIVIANYLISKIFVFKQEK